MFLQVVLSMLKGTQHKFHDTKYRKTKLNPTGKEN